MRLEASTIPLWKVPVWRAITWRQALALGLSWSAGSYLSWSLPMLFALGLPTALWLHRTAHRHREDPIYLSAALGLDPRIPDTERLRLSLKPVLDELAASRPEGLFAELSTQLEALIGRMLDLGFALRRLEGARTPAAVDRELHKIDLSLKGCKDPDERRQLEQARGHLQREQAVLVEMGAQRRRLLAQILTLSQFFRAMESELLCLSSRCRSGDNPMAPRMAEDARDALDAVRDLERTLAEMESPTLLSRAPAAGSGALAPREQVLVELLRASLADGTITPEENRSLVGCSRMLKLPESRCRELAHQVWEEIKERQAAGKEPTSGSPSGPVAVGDTVG